ncbi:MAG: hypothetical protein GXP62_18880, partial [Oligoflexia bacterium]|nr:hypothetical protein [Oligoflexia bacterium]
PKDVLPTPSQVAAAVATGDPRSAASATVVDHLREQYGQYGLRFTEPFVVDDGDGAVTQDASAQVGSGSMETQRELLASYFDHMIRRLRRGAEDQDKDAQSLVPPADAVAAAVASGDLNSAETAIVLDDLRSSYKTLDLDFTEPPR